MSRNVIGQALQHTLFKHASIATFNGYSRAIFKSLSICHTSQKGYHYTCCNNEQCGIPNIQYHACGNRHCPNCGGMKREAWVEAQMSDLLPTSYYHTVFTIPHELNSIIMGNRKAMFKLLFDASSYSLLKIAKDEKFLGATLGIISVLHTWGQDLSFHPHIHCIVSGGGINQTGHWKEEKRKNHRFLFPIAILQKVFKGYFMHEFRKRIGKEEIKIKDVEGLQHTMKEIGCKKWNIYAKAPFGGPQQVIQYLGRYTHKIAITAHRILSIDDTHTTFKYRDYADGNKEKQMTLTNEEFLRRFEQHFLPRRFVKIRHYGYFKNYKKKERLDKLFEKMNLPKRLPKLYIPVSVRMLERYGRDITICPHCEKGKMILVTSYRPKQEENTIHFIQHDYAKLLSDKSPPKNQI